VLSIRYSGFKIKNPVRRFPFDIEQGNINFMAVCNGRWASFRFVFYLAIVFLALSGCAGKHFRDAGNGSAPATQYDLTKNPSQEYWTGIVFSGDKIGFSHFKLSPAAGSPGCFEIVSDAVFSFRLFMMQKKFSMKSRDIVSGDLSLLHFEYDLDLDGSLMHQSGDVKGRELILTTVSSGREMKEHIPIEGKVFPESIMYLYPAIHGLFAGRTYEYLVFDGETRTISPAGQRILAYEESDLFEGKAFKIITTLHGEEATAWIDDKGRPKFEKMLGGVIISSLEPENIAKDYLASSVLNKHETMINFSLVRADKEIPHARGTEYLEVTLTGMNKDINIPSDSRQQCTWDGDKLIFRIIKNPDAAKPSPLSKSEESVYLMPTFVAPAADKRIRSAAASIVKGISDPHEQVKALVGWIRDNIEKEPVDVFTAIDVLEKKRAECQGHALLFTAFARSVGIPTRVANGLVYSEEYKGFLYHTWAESYVNGKWLSVDPTFSQIPPDATHIKLVEGEEPGSILPLVGILGRIRAEIIKVR
jgi:hypothetical protein